MEWRLQASGHPSTFEYHEHRERVDHLSQSWQSTRIYAAAKMARSVKPKTIVDLGCGDGGYLSVIQEYGYECWGYDFQPSNAEGWRERGVTAELRDVFNNRDVPRWGELANCTEVLEHLDDPHGAVEWIARNAHYFVASSPVDERPGGEPDCHIYAWDFDGYEDLLRPHFTILHHKVVDWSQVIMGKSRYV